MTSLGIDVRRLIGVGVFIAVACSPSAQTVQAQSTKGNATPPVVAQSKRDEKKPPEQMRALFVATANNIDWPPEPESRRVEQQDAMDAIIARALRLHCNTIILQVRAYGDRIHYDSQPDA